MSKSQPTSTSRTAVASTTTKTSGSKSSILQSSFAPSRFQLRLFASVIQSFDSQQLRIHDTTTGRLRSQHAGKAGSRITCMDWGHARPQVNGSQKSKSRKKDDIVLAYGTSTSEICLFAPTEGRVVAELTGQHERGILDVRFAQDTNNLWSIGADGRLIQWDIVSKKPLQSITLPEPSIQTLAPISDSSAILCASTTPHLISLDKQKAAEIPTFDAMQHPIHSLYQSKGSILAADGERYINMYGPNGRLSRTLVAKTGVETFTIESGDVTVLAPEDQQLLAALGKDGVLELFPKPFTVPQSLNGLKSSRKDLTQKSAAQIKLIDAASKQAVIFAASIQGGDILLASVTGGVDPSFQKVRWQDEGSGELLFAGTKDVVQSKSASSLSSANINGVKDMGKPYVDESSTVVTNGLGAAGSQDAAIAIESSDDDEEADEDSGSEAPADITDRTQANEAESDEEMEDAPAPPPPSSTLPAPISDPSEPPTFGDLLAAKEPPAPTNKTISIIPSPTTQTPSGAGTLQIPTGMSLATVLTQSLLTNDTPLLETCLHTDSPAIIRNTLTRLDPALSPPLITKLADRIISRPGRYGHLTIWVQHLCVAHGRAISANEEARNKMKVLYRALDQRSKGLSSLLLLKGKLQMVESQMRFRREVAAQRAEMGGGGARDHNVNVFIEGNGDNWDSSDDEDIDDIDHNGVVVKPRKRARKDLAQLVDDNDASSSSSSSGDEDEEMPSAALLTNGIPPADDSDSDNESQSTESEATRQDRQALSNGTLLDDEAEESSAEEDSDLESRSGSGSSSSENEDNGDEEEQDSELDAFINDGDISVEEDDEILDDAPPSDEEDDDVQPTAVAASKQSKQQKAKANDGAGKPKLKRRKV